MCLVKVPPSVTVICYVDFSDTLRVSKSTGVHDNFQIPFGCLGFGILVSFIRALLGLLDHCDCI